MGSPTKLGKQLNKLHRPKVDWLMVILLSTTLGLGFLPIFSLGYMDGGHFSTYKVIIVLLGGATALGLMLVDYRKWKKQGWLFYAGGIVVLLMIRFLSNITINGLPLLRIGPLTIESLMAIPFFFLAWASFFTNKRLKTWQFVVLFLPPFFLFLAVPDLSATYLYIVMVFGMLWWSEFSRKTIVTISGLTVSSFLLFGIISWQFLQFYQKNRLLAFLNPEKYSNGMNYLVLRSKELILKAGWFGNSTNKEFIPEAHTNFVLSALRILTAGFLPSCL